MKNKRLVLSVIFSSIVAICFSQDTSLLPSDNKTKSNQEIINSAADPNTRVTDPTPSSGAPHAAINPNTGTDIPATTSGTLNSPVNPSTQLVIPFHKSKKNGSSNTTPGQSITSPKAGITNVNDSSVILPKNK